MTDKREKNHWKGRHYSFFQNTECEYFPCHKGADPARFNCLFCYCPLYMLGPDCGGDFCYTEKGIKDCTGCLIPHIPENYGKITGKYAKILAKMRGNGPAPAKAEKKNRIVMMACTERGIDMMRQAGEALSDRLPDTEIIRTGRCAHVAGYEDRPSLSAVTEKWFHETDALIFIAAAGIAVRCIAPFVKDKFRDPAVLVLDENGKYVISLLSGHAGGANRLSRMLADALGAEPVITTATDGRGLFAVDSFAAERGLQISDRAIAKKVSARILAGETLKLYADHSPAVRDYGKGISRTKKRDNADIIISVRREPGDREDALYLIPPAVAIGIGCRKGISEEAVAEAVDETLRKAGVFRQAVLGIASIDRKKDEPGLLDFGRNRQLPVTFYTAEELRAIPGTFTGSAFVQDITGVDCVCERSAMRLAMDSGTAVLLEKKQRRNGVTTALALPEGLCPGAGKAAITEEGTNAE